MKLRKQKFAGAGASAREVERVILLRVIDAKWMDHIDDMDQLRQGIGLQAYGQRDPMVEYKMLGYDMFGEMTKAHHRRYGPLPVPRPHRAESGERAGGQGDRDQQG